MPRPPADPKALFEGIRAGDRAYLGRAITLIESRRPQDRAAARALLGLALPRVGRAMRVGITGSPGVGKSTLLEALGCFLLEKGLRVAVLAIDPSSTLSGGSILGDKTRMARLSADSRAFIRPSPSGGTLGGVALRTRETLLLCEAAGFDVVIVETVGVGQSEVTVAYMVDSFVMLVQPGAGDDLQGIKRGILELADVVAVTKADGDNIDRALRSRGHYDQSLRLLLPRHQGWKPPVLTCSALQSTGLEKVWSEVLRHRQHLEQHQLLEMIRADQRVHWMWHAVETSVVSRLRSTQQVHEIEDLVRAGHLLPDTGAEQLLSTLS